MTTVGVLVRITLSRHFLLLNFVLIRHWDYAAAQPNIDNKQNDMSGDFLNFVRDMGNIVYHHNKETEENEAPKQHTRKQLPVNEPPSRIEKHKETQKMQKDTLRDVLMMKLVSYYEEKYKLSHENEDLRKILKNQEHKSLQPHNNQENNRIHNDDGDHNLPSHNKEIGYRISQDSLNKIQPSSKNEHQYRISESNIDKVKLSHGNEYRISDIDDVYNNKVNKLRKNTQKYNKPNVIQENVENYRMYNNNNGEVAFLHTNEENYRVNNAENNIPQKERNNYPIPERRIDSANKYKYSYQSANNYRRVMNLNSDAYMIPNNDVFMSSPSHDPIEYGFTSTTNTPHNVEVILDETNIGNENTGVEPIITTNQRSSAEVIII